MKFFYENQNLNLYKDSKAKKYILRYDLIIKINRGDPPIFITIEKSNVDLGKLREEFKKDLEKEAKKFVSKYVDFFNTYQDFLDYLEI